MGENKRFAKATWAIMEQLLEVDNLEEALSGSLEIIVNTLNSEVKNVWERTKYVINNLPVDLRENGRFKSIFPKQSENRVCHVRPHARNAEDTYELPDGRLYTKQCFWLNNSYILEQIKDYL